LGRLKRRRLFEARMTDSKIFENKLEFFKEHQNAPWSRLHYNIALSNLKRHITGKELTILDAGGGNGIETISLAQQGNKVVLLDYSDEMLAEARNNAKKYNLPHEINYIKGDVSLIPQLFEKESFDIVLCHRVLQYVENKELVLNALSYAVKLQGILSIICINRYSEPYRLAIQENNLSDAYKALDSNVIMSKVFDTPMKAYSAKDFSIPLQESGYEIIGEYGIRCINDYIANNESKSDPKIYEEIEKLEYSMSDKYPYYLLARSFHIVAKKVNL
jgi:S-adenosylmethionine-dependent methyltransferase